MQRSNLLIRSIIDYDARVSSLPKCHVRFTEYFGEKIEGMVVSMLTLALMGCADPMLFPLFPSHHHF